MSIVSEPLLTKIHVETDAVMNMCLCPVALTLIFRFLILVDNHGIRWQNMKHQTKKKKT